jgi:hypothetical protein
MPTIKIGGADREIKYPFEAVRRVSKELNQSVAEILSAGVDMSNIDTMIVLIWGGLLHNARKLTVEMVSAWLDDVDNYPEIVAICAQEYVDSVSKKLHLVPQEEEEDDEEKN